MEKPHNKQTEQFIYSATTAGFQFNANIQSVEVFV